MEKNYFASNLRYLRSIKGLKQEDLAKICNKSKSTICMWEKEEREPYLEDVILLATYFDVSVDEMVNKQILLDPYDKKLERAIMDNVRLLSEEEQKKVLAILELMSK